MASSASLLSTEKPSKPRCYTEGSTHEGKDVVLRCTSDAGSKPMKYSWEKTTGSKVLPASSVLGNAAFHKVKPFKGPAHNCLCLTLSFFTVCLDPVSGTVNVKNASASASGTYRCTATNRVGAEQCVLDLSVTASEYPTVLISVYSVHFTCRASCILVFNDQVWNSRSRSLKGFPKVIPRELLSLLGQRLYLHQGWGTRGPVSCRF